MTIDIRALGCFTQRYVKRQDLIEGLAVYDPTHFIRALRTVCIATPPRQAALSRARRPRDFRACSASCKRRS
jgi:hypothetical protein